MVSLIIVDYKTVPKTLQYINECYQFIIAANQIHAIIVDNCEDSSIGLQLVEKTTKSKAKKILIKNIKTEIYLYTLEGNPLLYVCAKQNIGYAKGNNLGALIAKSYYKDSYYLFSNNDLRFLQEFKIEQLLEPMKKNIRIGVVGPKIIGIEGAAQSPRKKISFWKQLFLTYYDLILPKKMKITKWITDVDNHNRSESCYWVTGSFLLADAAKFHESKGFDEHTFLYCEEIILAERLQQLGYHMYYENDIVLIHEHGQTVKSAFSAIKGIHISFQSSLYYYRKYRNLNVVLFVLARINYALFAILFIGKKSLGKLLCK